MRWHWGRGFCGCSQQLRREVTFRRDMLRGGVVCVAALCPLRTTTLWSTFAATLHVSMHLYSIMLPIVATEALRLAPWCVSQRGPLQTCLATAQHVVRQESAHSTVV